MTKFMAERMTRIDPDERERYLEGRISYDADPYRRLRFEAGWDICLATLGILKEYASDCESEYFACVHDEDLAIVRVLIEEMERIDDPNNADIHELDSLSTWLHKVADVLPRLWD